MSIVVHPAAAGQIDGLVKAPPAGTVLLHGPRAVGKRTVALDVARRLNCTGCRDASCRSCTMAAGGNHPNIIIIDPDEKGKIGVEAVHELQHALQYQQYEPHGQRVVVLADADTLTLPAQNALLKTLEEPPADTLIIVTASRPAALLPTVLSRCRLVYLPPVTDELIAPLLAGRPGPQVQTIMARSQGLPGLALTYLADPERLAQADETSEQVAALLAAEGMFQKLQRAAALASEPERREDYLQTLTEQVRSRARQSAERATNLAALDRLRARLQANVSPKTAFEALAVELV